LPNLDRIAVEHKFGLFDRRAVVWAVEAHRSDQLSVRTNDVKPINVHTRRSLGSGGSFIDSLSPTNAEVGALIKPACALCSAGRKIIRAGAPAFCLHPTAHIFLPSNPARTARDNFSSMLAIGIGSLIFVEFIVNVAMVLGIFPVVGMPLPNGCAQLYRR
jgi:hypothetical protein